LSSGNTLRQFKGKPSVGRNIHRFPYCQHIKYYTVKYPFLQVQGSRS
jgi:hypothetical protein